MDPRKIWALVLGCCTLAIQGASLVLAWGPFGAEGASNAHFLMVLVGGPVCLLAGLIFGLRWSRTAGAILWLGGALEAMGIALKSGSMVGRYFLGLSLFVVPQVIVASLFLLHARDSQKSPSAH
jgi:hypothetical protein